MIAVDWIAFGIGLAAGIGVSVLYFAGLALGMRYALRSARPGVLLLLSAGLRIAALLAVGGLVAHHGGSWAAIGYALAFLLVRLAATTVACPSHTPAKGATWN